MNILLELSFIFFIGSVFGLGTELLFRRFISSANPERKWINPGFCTGPYLPLYGVGLCVLFLVANLEKYCFTQNSFLNKIVLFIIMSILMTGIEYIAGIIALKVSNIRLWDYSDKWGNIKGIICPEFSLIWALLGGIYYFAIHPLIKDSVRWLSENLAFSFFIGLFFGVFIIDVVHSMQLVAKLKKYADENKVIIRYEQIKLHIRNSYEQTAKKYRFFHPFSADRPVLEYIKDIKGTLEEHQKKK